MNIVPDDLYKDDNFVCRKINDEIKCFDLSDNPTWLGDNIEVDIDELPDEIKEEIVKELI